MFIGRIGLSIIALAVSAAQAAAQQSPLMFINWQKACNDPPAAGCTTTMSAVNPSGFVVAMVQVIEIDGTGPKVLRTFLRGDVAKPDSPVSIAIDNAPPTPIKIQECAATHNLCYADLPTTAAVTAALKTGKTLRIDIIKPSKTSYSFPLAGYAAVVDSKGLTSKDRQEMERKAEEARKRLEKHIEGK